MDNEDVGRTQRGKEALHAPFRKERVGNAPLRTRGCGRGRREEPEGSSSQSLVPTKPTYTCLETQRDDKTNGGSGRLNVLRLCYQLI